MKILVSGASGLVGEALLPRLIAAGHDVCSLARVGGSSGRNSISWDVATGALDRSTLEKWGGPDAVIHLAGESIAGRRWNAEQKRRIRRSRVEATQLLVAHLSELTGKLKVFVGASAVGFYGDCGDEILAETSGRGEGFLAETCESWEAAASPLVSQGVRMVHLRFGMILSRKGGALAKMLPIFRLGLGGRLGNGRQWVSWIVLEDVVRAIEFALDSAISGPHNVVSPQPVQNIEFTRLLSKGLHRPAILTVPRFALRVAFGELADAALLSSQRVLPQRLQDAGFQFNYDDLSKALKQVLYRN